jgi:hypothetical protein
MKERAPREVPWAPTFCLVPETGLEPVRYLYRRILSPVRLPFRHSGVELSST